MIDGAPTVLLSSSSFRCPYNLGSAIAPSLFLAYINDLPEYVNPTVHLFAEDTVMHLIIHSEDQCRQ